MPFGKNKPTGYYAPEETLSNDYVELPIGIARRVILYDVNGNVVSDSLAAYKVSDTDQQSSTRYYGFVNPDGAWYILQEIIGTTPSYRYAAGASSYTTNWTGRAGLSYDYYYNVF